MKFTNTQFYMLLNKCLHSWSGQMSAHSDRRQHTKLQSPTASYEPNTLGTIRIMECQCDKIKTRKYISSPDQLGEALAYAKELQKNNILELLTDEGDNSDYFHKTYKCKKCNTQFLLSCEAYHGSGGSFGLNSQIKSEYISQIDYLCQKNRSPEKYRGNDIYDSSKSGEWVYYDCYFDEKSIRERFKLPTHIKYFEYDGRASGQESGFVDEKTNDAVLGNHPDYARKKNLKLIK